MKRIEEKLTAISDAIRKKAGGTELLSLDEMPSEIAAIGTGIKTDDATAVAGDILSGKTAYAKDVKITGTIPTKTQGDLTVSEATITVPSGYYSSQVSKSVTTTTQAVPSISINNNGLITASTTQTAGYVTAGTKSATKQLTTKAAATITPSTSNQTIAAGTYLTGTQTIAGDADLVASNIKKGINIFNVYGSYEGVELNFEVVGGTTQPVSGVENTIWINTNTEITSWVFSYTEPENPVEGMVWICTGSVSSVDFNALKNNTLKVYPVSAKQYISGAWVDKTAKSYQNGAWVDWIRYLYINGNEFLDMTGGWSKLYNEGTYGFEAKLYKKDEYMLIAATTETTPIKYDKRVMIGTSGQVSLSGRKTLYMECEIYPTGKASDIYAYFGVGSDIKGTNSKFTNSIEFAKGISVNGTWVSKRVSLDISSAPQNVQIGVYCGTVNNSSTLIVKILKVWMG